MSNQPLWDEHGQPLTRKITEEDWNTRMSDNNVSPEEQIKLLQKALLKNGIKPVSWGVKSDVSDLKH